MEKLKMQNGNLWTNFQQNNKIENHEEKWPSSQKLLFCKILKIPYFYHTPIFINCLIVFFFVRN